MAACGVPHNYKNMLGICFHHHHKFNDNWIMRLRLLQTTMFTLKKKILEQQKYQLWQK
jgi:hypothetical protein